MEAFKRQCDILKANYAVFMRRANDENYGTKDDRDLALYNARVCDADFKNVTGKTITEDSLEDKV